MPFAQSFSRLRQLAGNPVLTCVKPRAQWVGVPSGYSYDADYDTFLNSGGDEWRPTSTADLSSNDYTTVEWLSMKSGGDKDVLTIGGTSETGEKYGIIKSASMSTVANAQWFEIDSRTFDKAELTSVPSGVGTWYEVRLTKR